MEENDDQKDYFFRQTTSACGYFSGGLQNYLMLNTQEFMNCSARSGEGRKRVCLLLNTRLRPNNLGPALFSRLGIFGPQPAQSLSEGTLSALVSRKVVDSVV